MDKNHFKVILFVAAALMIVGCATPKAVPTFKAQDLNPVLQAGDYVPRVDNFVVILDKSGSMGDLYKGQKKLDSATCTVRRMNQTIPDLTLNGALRVFGRSEVFCKQLTRLLWGPAAYSRNDLDSALNQVGYSVGESPLNEALDATGQDLKSAQGDIAVLVFTDANKEYMNYDAVKKSAIALKKSYGDRLCIHTVQIGNDAEGKQLLEQVNREGRCGYYVNADQIASSEGMADFVTKVFLKKAPPKPAPVAEVVEEKVVEKVEEKVVILDTDGDGVPDNLDKCPGTPRGANVDRFGCWVLKNVLFDFNKYDIKPQYHTFLNQAAAVFEKNPNIRVEIEGHTDNIGTAAYNMKLSQERANAVRDYLVNKGVSKDRLSTKGYGFTRPIATNATQEGRALNRRVQLTPLP